jgi:hypothetical protein
LKPQQHPRRKRNQCRFETCDAAAEEFVEHMETRVNKKPLATLLALVALALVGGCATFSPNSDEQAADRASYDGNSRTALEIVTRHAEAGEPWAELRLGMVYEDASGPRKGVRTAIERYEWKEFVPGAIEWYKKAAAQKATGAWAEGARFGASGRDGYFNQNNYARIAQYRLANIYLKGQGIKKDLEQAYLNIRAVVDETKGRDIFFCCEFSGGTYVTAVEISKTYDAVLKQMSDEQKQRAEDAYLRQLRDRKK